jgi:hypothetical protein
VIPAKVPTRNPSYPQPAKPARASRHMTPRATQSCPASTVTISHRFPDYLLFSTQAFTLKNSGNRTLRAPKQSWRIILDAAGHGNRLAGMTRINLKAMY